MIEPGGETVASTCRQTGYKEVLHKLNLPDGAGRK